VFLLSKYSGCPIYEPFSSLLSWGHSEDKFKKEDSEVKRKLKTYSAFILSLAMVMVFSWMAMAEEVPRISKEEVREMLGRSDLIIVDVRSEKSWDGAELKIKGAVREDPTKVNSWMDKYPKDKTLVFY
jgi:hypothetical protein